MLASFWAFLFLIGSYLCVITMVLFGFWYLLRIWKRSSLAPKPKNPSPDP